jgi:hypothetical protein
VPTPDDHVHSAAALAAGVGAIITWDTTGFPTTDLAALGLRVTDPDTYLTELHDEFPDDVTATITQLARTKTRPPMSPADVLNALDRAGLKHFPDRLRSHPSGVDSGGESERHP